MSNTGLSIKSDKGNEMLVTLTEDAHTKRKEICAGVQAQGNFPMGNGVEEMDWRSPDSLVKT